MGNLGEPPDSEGKATPKPCEPHVHPLVDSGRSVLPKEAHEMVAVGLEEEKKICNAAKIIPFDKPGACLTGDKSPSKSEIFAVSVGLSHSHENIHHLDNGPD